MCATEPAPPVVLSPHFDDAVLSAWHVLSENATGMVVTVFGGVPEPGFVTDLDRAHHADDSAAWLERRRVEDGAAVALAGWEPEHLEFLEAQFPAWQIPQMRAAIANAPDQFVSLVADDPRIETDPDTLLAEVAPLLPADATVYGPVGIGGHPDHRDLARATIRLRGRVRSVRLYADSPYFVFHGLPTYCGADGDEAADGDVAADRWINEALDRVVDDDISLVRHVERLSAPAFERKLDALRCYTTEFPLVLADLEARGGPEMLRYEIWWELDGGA